MTGAMRVPAGQRDGRDHDRVEALAVIAGPGRQDGPDAGQMSAVQKSERGIGAGAVGVAAACGPKAPALAIGQLRRRLGITQAPAAIAAT